MPLEAVQEVAGTGRGTVVLALSSLLAIRDGVAEASRRAPATRARRTRPKRRCWNPDKAAAWALACEVLAGDGGFKEDGLWAFDSLNGNCAAAAQAYCCRCLPVPGDAGEDG